MGSCFEISRKPVELVPRIDETIGWAAWSFSKVPWESSLDVLWTHSSSWACCVRCINNGLDATGILKPQSCWEDTWREEKLGRSPAVDICLVTSSYTRRACCFLSPPSISSWQPQLVQYTAHAILFHWTLLSMGQLIKASAPLLSSVWILSAKFLHPFTQYLHAHNCKSTIATLWIYSAIDHPSARRFGLSSLHAYFRSQEQAQKLSHRLLASSGKVCQPCYL